MGMSEARCGRCDGVGSPTKGPKSQQPYEVAKKKPNGNNGHAKPDFGGEGGALAGLGLPGVGIAHQGPKKSIIVQRC